MKQSVVCIILSLILIIPTSKAFAETSVDIENNGNGALSNVHVENNVGQNTTNNSATVCINDQCTTSQDGNVDRQEGGASVHIQNNSNNSSVGSPTPTGQQPQANTNQSPTTTITPTPTHEASHSAQITPPKTQDNKSQQSSIEQMIANIQNFINQLFSTHK